MAQSSRDVESNKVDRTHELERLLSGKFSNLWSAVQGRGGKHVDRVYFRLGDGGVWTCVVKCLDTDSPEPLVVFGQGATLAGSLAAADKSISQGKWRVDRPWTGGT